MDPIHKYGPKSADHPSVGKPCPACDMLFVAGDFTTLISMGPGDDPEEQKRAQEGRAYNSIAAEVHFACATGRET